MELKLKVKSAMTITLSTMMDALHNARSRKVGIVLTIQLCKNLHAFANNRITNFNRIVSNAISPVQMGSIPTRLPWLAKNVILVVRLVLALRNHNASLVLKSPLWILQHKNVSFVPQSVFDVLDQIIAPSVPQDSIIGRIPIAEKSVAWDIFPIIKLIHKTQFVRSVTLTVNHAMEHWPKTAWWLNKDTFTITKRIRF